MPNYNYFDIFDEDIDLTEPSERGDEIITGSFFIIDEISKKKKSI